MFRTHLGRSIDPSSTSNRLIIGLTAVAALAGGALWLAGEAPQAWLAPVHTFLTWALVRELDPDRPWTALLAAALAGGWVLAGFAVVGALPLVGFLMAGRLVLNPVGLRPLNTDLAAMAVVATAISFTAIGWVAGSGVALGIYIDSRLADEPERSALVAALAAAVGSTAVATAADALPATVPSFGALVIVLIGVIGLIVVIRDPLTPETTVDSGRHQLMSPQRLHSARVLTAVLLFVSALLAGQSANGLGPLIIAVALTLVAEELERIRRPTM